VATALAVHLERAGNRVVAATGGSRSEERVRRYLPSARFYPASEAHLAARAAPIALIGVPDDMIEPLCSNVAGHEAFGRGKWVVHLSGSVGLAALEAARRLGAHVLSVHPLQAFPTVESGIEHVPGSPMAVTATDEDGYAFGATLAEQAGGRPFRLPDEVKPLYHAAAVFCSNFLVTVEAVAEGLFRLAGMDDPVSMFAPLARATLDATLSLGPEDALTGPAVRGDRGTVRRNLEALARAAPEAIPAYVALSRMAAGLAARSGRLSAEDQRRVTELLDAWS